MYSVAMIKDSMRITHNKLDGQIGRDINSCLSALTMAGIAVKDATGAFKDDPLIDKAVELYCKASADYQGQGGRYTDAYESLRNAMQGCGDYRS
jgi:hypothetical protein